MFCQNINVFEKNCYLNSLIPAVALTNTGILALGTFALASSKHFPNLCFRTGYCEGKYVATPSSAMQI